MTRTISVTIAATAAAILACAGAAMAQSTFSRTHSTRNGGSVTVDRSHGGGTRSYTRSYTGPNGRTRTFSDTRTRNGNGTFTTNRSFTGLGGRTTSSSRTYTRRAGRRFGY